MEKNKVYFVSALITFFFFVLVLRLFNIQILEKQKFISYIEKQYQMKESIVLPRGAILDRNGDIFAISVPTISIFAIPEYIKNKEKLAKELSKILKIPERKILRKLKRKKHYTVIAENVDKKLKPRLLELRKDLQEWNLGILESSKRFYPLGDVAGTTIGFVNRKTGVGMEGLEYKLNKKLGGGLGKILLMKDALGNPFTIEKKLFTRKQFNAQLTIDKNIQFMAEKALEKLVFLRKPKEAAVLILDPYTGDILAAATYPDYNPNKYWLYKNHRNIIFQNAYEPGSLAKPFIYALAYEKEILNPKKRYYCGNGKIKIGRRIIRDHARFKYLTADEIIIHSSNVGIIKIALELDKNEIYNFLKKAGFGTSTKTFPGEASGILRKPYGKGEVAYMSIGQSWIASIIQIGMAYSAIANGGWLLKPRLVKSFIDTKTGEKEEVPVVKVRKLFKKETVEKLKEVLKLVVEEGTAKPGKSKFFTIAGKTGTAQKYDPKIKSLSREKHYTWFAGFFPVEKPKYTIVIFANEPKQIYKWEHIGGGKVSSTVMKELIDQLMFYSKEKPDKVSVWTPFRGNKK